MDKRQMLEMAILIVSFALVFTVVTTDYQVNEVRTNDWIVEDKWDIGETEVITEDFPQAYYYEPDVYDGNIAFIAEVSTEPYDDHNVVMYMNDTGFYNITNSYYSNYADINGNFMVFTYDGDVAWKNLSTGYWGLIESTDDYDSYPRIYDDVVVYQGGYPTNIYLYWMNNLTLMQITNTSADYCPDIYGDMVVWMNYDSGEDKYYIKYMDISTMDTGILVEGMNPRIWENYVVYEKWNTFGWIIAMYDLDTNSEVSIMPINETISGFLPVISDDIIAFYVVEDGIYNVAMIDMDSHLFGEYYYVLTETEDYKYWLNTDNGQIVWSEQTGYDEGERFDVMSISVTEIGEEEKEIIYEEVYNTDWIYFTAIITISLIGLIAYYVSEYKMNNYIP